MAVWGEEMSDQKFCKMSSKKICEMTVGGGTQRKRDVSSRSHNCHHEVIS